MTKVLNLLTKTLKFLFLSYWKENKNKHLCVEIIQRNISNTIGLVLNFPHHNFHINKKKKKKRNRISLNVIMLHKIIRKTDEFHLKKKMEN